MRAGDCTGPADLAPAPEASCTGCHSAARSSRAHQRRHTRAAHSHIHSHALAHTPTHLDAYTRSNSYAHDLPQPNSDSYPGAAAHTHPTRAARTYGHPVAAPQLRTIERPTACWRALD